MMNCSLFKCLILFLKCQLANKLICHNFLLQSFKTDTQLYKLSYICQYKRSPIQQLIYVFQLCFQHLNLQNKMMMKQNQNINNVRDQWSPYSCSITYIELHSDKNQKHVKRMKDSCLKENTYNIYVSNYHHSSKS